MSNLSADDDVNDLLKSVRDAVSFQDRLFALPFYAESAMTYYRADLFAKAGLKMPATHRELANHNH
jgi:sorbitol/mannitol transport system substrate-binding protein